MNGQRCAQFTSDFLRAASEFGGVGAHADIECAAGTDEEVEGGNGFLDRRLRVGAVVVENVHIIQPHALQRGIAAGHKVFPRATETVGAILHVPASLGGNDHLIAVGSEILGHDATEVFLRGTLRWAVIVGEVEVRDAVVEGGAQNLTLCLERPVITKVMPKSQRNGRKFQASVAGAVVGHRFIAVVIGVVHVWISHVFEGTRALRRAFVHRQPSTGRVAEWLPLEVIKMSLLGNK